MYAARGEVTERPMVLAWKAGVVNATGGSNPPLSAIFCLADEKRPSAALPSSRLKDVPNGTPYSAGFQAPSIWAYLIRLVACCQIENNLVYR